MSPNTAGVTAATDVQMPTQDAVMAAGNQGSDDGVAVRTMAVAVATSQSGGTPNWQAMEASPPERMEMAHERIMGAAEHSFGQMNAAQASWSVMATRRSTPAWIQRLGAFFQEMRSQQTAWPPSPLGSPPARPMQSQRGSPEMEQRGERQPEGNGSSGGSTYEAVQEEVKRRKIYDKKWSFCVQREDRLFYHWGVGLTCKDCYKYGTWWANGTRTTERGNDDSGAMTGSGGATAGSSDPMSRLLEGLEKVIKGGKPEELSKAVDAPKLPEISESSSVDFGDWLYLIEHVMSDLSTSSAEWWATVVRDAQDFYERYQAADQFSRLSMKPTASPTLNEVRWSRLDRRGATILLGATPDDIKKELVATRTRTTLEVLARLMVIYRPGSALEKGQLLRRIESPDTAATVQEAIEGLRQWLRHYQRARDLKLSVPDPSVTLRGIDQLVKKPIQENPEIAFRMNLLRYHLKVDFSPAEESVLAVHRALLAEFEQMGFKKKAKQVQEGTSTARVRAALDSRFTTSSGPHGCYANVTFVYWERTKDTMPSSDDQDEEEVSEQEGPDPSQVKQAQRMAGELLWLVTRTRPDIGYATAHVCATALKSPIAAIRLGKMVVRYLAATPTWGLTYNGVGEPVEAYSDARFAPQGDRSFGCVTTATYGGFAAWRMTKQPTVVLSAAEAELVELVNASQQAAGLQAWVEEVSPQDAGKPLILRVDNTAACGLATTSPGSWKTRHLKVKARHLRFETNEGRIKVVHTPGEVQAADMGTKPVPVARLVDLRKLWGLCAAEDFEADEEEDDGVDDDGFKDSRGQGHTGIYNKKPLDYDGSVEFYVLMLVAGIALLAVWEAMKWVAQRLFGEDEATVTKARKLLRIRNQASKALQQELESMSASSSDPINIEKPSVATPKVATTPLSEMSQGPMNMSIGSGIWRYFIAKGGGVLMHPSPPCICAASLSLRVVCMENCKAGRNCTDVKGVAT
ncbi:GIP [Symbiodinium microadriaticum]|nr:GIP [Symbiodinium microadriaticum]